MKHLFIIDPVERLNLPIDTSLHLADALIRSGETIYLCHPSDLTLTKKSIFADVFQLRKFSTERERLEFGLRESVPLADFASIYLRKDPPFDLSYITATWLLDFAGPDCKVYNSPQSLRTYNEKLSIFHFPQYVDHALFTADVKALVNFLGHEAGGDAILKPIDLYGGRDIVRIQQNKMNDGQILELLNQQTQNGTLARLMQPFNTKIFDGEVRAFYAKGTPIAWCLKKPKENQFLANTGAGATLHPFTPSKKLETDITDVAKQLWAKGAALVGFDIIGERISEINITSPRLLAADPNKKPYFDKMAKVMLG